MAKAKKRAKSAGGKQSPRRRRAAKQQDAIDLLMADHRQVEEWFEQFESTRSNDRKRRLSGQICEALKVHAQIEEEIFYPAFLEATDDEDVHHEAEVEHEGAKRLIADIEASGVDDDYYDARVTVLSEMIKHHVNEEEKRDGMFSKARKADMDLVGLGQQLEARKAELMGDSEGGSGSRSHRPRGGEAQPRA
jgi:hemerythrin superfamily protein